MTEQQFTSDDRANLLETIKRCRRIETRLTRFLESEGVQIDIQRPYWRDGRVILPTPTISIDAIMRCIPARWPTPVLVVLQGGESDAILCGVTLV